MSLASPLRPDRVEMGDFGTVIIYDREGQRLEYACDTSGTMTAGRIIRYPWSKVRDEIGVMRTQPLEIAMFVPLAPYCVPWVLGVVSS